MVKRLILMNSLILLMFFMETKAMADPGVQDDEPGILTTQVEKKSFLQIEKDAVEDSSQNIVQKSITFDASKEFRFDALRIEGATAGPQVLVMNAKIGWDQSPLLRLRRSFLFRVFETIETPAVHGGS